MQDSNVTPTTVHISQMGVVATVHLPVDATIEQVVSAFPGLMATLGYNYGDVMAWMSHVSDEYFGAEKKEE